MNELTLCLITKGRPEYLDELLDSLERAVQFDYVKVLVILNGVSADVEAKFRAWEENAPAKVNLKTFTENEAGLSRFWPIISTISTKWVTFPSDDDILNEEFFARWVGFESTYSQFGAIATGLKLIDSAGSKVGITRTPSYSPEMRKPEFIARALSECPFLWPGLVIQISHLPKQVPNSRYVSDWWIGFYLLFSTEVTVSESVLLNYRIHETQESAVASLARKNLEATIHLGNFIHGNIFAEWVTGASSQELEDFLHHLIFYPPLYGDTTFSSEIISIITGRVIALRVENEVQVRALFVNALAHNVLIDEKQLKFLGLTHRAKVHQTNSLNFNIEFSRSACSAVKTALAIHSIHFKSFPTIVIGCRHAAPGSSQIELDCNNLSDKGLLMDSLLMKSSEYLGSIDYFKASVSPFEYRIVRKLRSVKKRIPGYLNRLVYAVFGR
jgi:hypothetical protein